MSHESHDSRVSRVSSVDATNDDGDTESSTDISGENNDEVECTDNDGLTLSWSSGVM